MREGGEVEEAGDAVTEQLTVVAGTGSGGGVAASGDVVVGVRREGGEGEGAGGTVAVQLTVEAVTGRDGVVEVAAGAAG